MKTEISRDSHQPERRYSGVYQQQGRMLTDADWNELVEILKERLNSALRDVVGNKAGSMGGTPRHRALRVGKKTKDGPLTIQPGHIYVDGIAAQILGNKPFTYDAQLDFPEAPDLPKTPDFPGSSPKIHIIYADVWERTVTHLMDERLRDKGLHGADTCTRKQMMAQVKWCPRAIDPEQSVKNPPKGDAELSLKLLHKTAETDPCDPCAAQLDVESKVGNYLFRVEVHDVKGDADSPTEITLKWSSENGAEQFEALATKDEMPAGFITEKWVYEFFDMTSEKHLGVHFGVSPWEPVRGMLEEIKEAYSVPTIPGSSETEKFVRRWDGYCKLDLSSETVIEGMDRGVALSTSKDSDAPGYVKIDSTSLHINLSSINLDIVLDSKRFVAGDYWLADVREAEHDPLDPEKSTLIEDALPNDIEHHYLTLGEVVDGVLQPNPEVDRKYAFPPLTEMTRMFMAGGDGQEVVPGEALPQPLRVAVANGEWPVAGAKVRFQALADDESLTPLSVVETNSDGIAKYVWTTDAAIDAFLKVKATLVDPNDSDNDLDHPPVYFYANLITADQVAYEPGCPDSGENAVHSHLVTDSELDLGEDNYYTVKEVLDALLCNLKAKHLPYDDPNCASLSGTVKSLLPEPGLDFDGDGHITVSDVLDTLLCKLKAKHIPYDPTQKPQRWEDINEEVEGVPSKPETVQDAIDNIVDNLESSDIRYTPDCGVESGPTVQSELGIPTDQASKVDEVFDKLLCEFKATHLPIDKNEVLCDTLNQADIETVQDALKVLCDRKPSGGCAVTVGEGGKYPTLEAAFNSEELKKESQIRICLLPRTDKGSHIIENLDVSGKQSISITGHDTQIIVRGQSSLEAVDIALSGICFSVIDKESRDGTGTGSITLSSTEGGNVVVEHCHFSRTFYGEAAKWQPLVTVGKMTSLKWVENNMSAFRQDEEIRLATIPEWETTPEASIEAYDALEAVWRMNPYEDLDAFNAKLTAAAKKISGLTSATREEWYAKRPVTLIDKLPIETIRISLPGTGIGGLEPTPGREGLEPTPGTGGLEPAPGRGGLEPMPGRGGLEPISGRVTPRFLAGVTARLARLAAVSEVSPRGEVNKFFELLKSAEAIDVVAIADAIHTVAELVNRVDYALALESNDVWGWITNNDISGYVALHNKQDNAVQLSWASTESPERQGNKNNWAKESLASDLSVKYQLSLHGNNLTAVHSMIPDETLKAIHEMLDSGQVPEITIRAYESMTVRDNTFYEESSSFITEFLNLSGNQFLYRSEKGATLAYALGFRGAFIGNMSYAKSADEFGDYKIEQIFDESIKQWGLNLLRIV